MAEPGRPSSATNRVPAPLFITVLTSHAGTLLSTTPSCNVRKEQDKIRLLGFTTLHDSRRYAIPLCWVPHTQTQSILSYLRKEQGNSASSNITWSSKLAPRRRAPTLTLTKRACPSSGVLHPYSPGIRGARRHTTRQITRYKVTRSRSRTEKSDGAGDGRSRTRSQWLNACSTRERQSRVLHPPFPRSSLGRVEQALPRSELMR